MCLHVGPLYESFTTELTLKGSFAGVRLYVIVHRDLLSEPSPAVRTDEGLLPLVYVIVVSLQGLGLVERFAAHFTRVGPLSGVGQAVNPESVGNTEDFVTQVTLVLSICVASLGAG